MINCDDKPNHSTQFPSAGNQFICVRSVGSLLYVYVFVLGMSI